MVSHFYDSSPSGPAEQDARLRHLIPLLDAGIPFVVIAEDALSIVHRVPTSLFEMQILVPDHLVSIAARTLCAHAPYRIADSASPRWRKFILEERRWGPSAWNTTFTVPLVHISPDIVEKQYWRNPTHILVHPQSSFHFDLLDKTRTYPNPDPPSSDLASILYPTLPAFLDMLIETVYHPPVDHIKVKMHLGTMCSYLYMYSMADSTGALFEGKPWECKAPTFDLDRLMPHCWKILDGVKDENKLVVSRAIMGAEASMKFEWERFERNLIKQGLRHELRISSPPAVFGDNTKGLTRKIQTEYAGKTSSYSILRHRWPRVFRRLPKF
ncbi:hypothetical protein D9619_007888 [Psilocybe cf. subviscida]|uniref:Ribonucleotide reductase large subunit domain-containing protein n=1 Tax=Psilocybe cf. subviscida TaxID=2480587 RepID=A0A8H5AUI5_9AGAR|nr:hypothetical protein D9619_007888 [Psilocybe cf. subviscida]